MLLGVPPVSFVCFSDSVTTSLLVVDWSHWSNFSRLLACKKLIIVFSAITNHLSHGKLFYEPLCYIGSTFFSGDSWLRQWTSPKSMEKAKISQWGLKPSLLFSICMLLNLISLSPTLCFSYWALSPFRPLAFSCSSFCKAKSLFLAFPYYWQHIKYIPWHRKLQVYSCIPSLRNSILHVFQNISLE